MANIKIIGRSLRVSGEIGYAQAGEFATLCDRFLRENQSGPAVIDLSAARDLVSPCLTAIYDDARLHRPVNLKVTVPPRLVDLFKPGEMEGLFTVEAVGQ